MDPRCGPAIVNGHNVETRGICHYIIPRHNDMRRHMDIHHPPDSSKLGGDNWITRSHTCHNPQPQSEMVLRQICNLSCVNCQ